MMPNFALNMSEDGIALLHRAANGAGWVEVGRVSLDAADLGAELTALRETAAAIEGSDFATKLILPPSQLLYADITIEGDLSADVVTALEDRTPYSVDELSYDISGAPPQVQVVAVARETLAEAEGFIGPYDFNPVGFTAIPEPGHFSGEPNLGAMPSSGADFDPDPEPIRIISAEEAMPVLADMEATAEENETTEPVAPELLDAEEPVIAEEDATEPEAAMEPAPAEIEAATEVEPEPAVPDTAPPAEEASADEEPDLETASVESPPGETPPAAFSSRRRPVLGPATDTPGERVTSRAPRIAIPTDETTKSKKSKTPPRIEPRIKTGEAAKSKPAPPIIPPATPPYVAEAAKPAKKSPSRMGAGIAALKKRKKTVPPVMPSADKPDPIAELAARQAAGKPRFLGLILTGILIVVLLLFAVFSSYLLPDEVARLFGRDTPQETEIAIAPPPPATPEAVEEFSPIAEPDVPSFIVPAPEEIAEAETPEPEQPAPLVMSETDAETAYAVSGIWQLPPAQRQPQVELDLDTLYENTLDPELAFEDAPALARFDPDAQRAPTLTATPPPADILFSLDERGLVRPSPEGALNPDGVLVFTGPPPVAAVPRPGPAPLVETPPEDAAEVEPATDPETDLVEAETAAVVVDPRLAVIRPALRPEDLQERFERANQGGRSTAELARIRPEPRPQSAIEQARDEAIARALAEAEAGVQEAEARAAAEAAAQAELDRPTAQAVARSTRPGARPRNFARVVARAREAAPAPAAAASTASVARATGPAVARASRASPTGTTRASVARAATDNNAISLGRVALVGVFGTSSNRRALVRMPNGRFKKVSVGDRVDGGRVAAIGEGQLKYTKGGRTLTLEMPKG
ncbi:hypothetical protein C8N43_2927 [Litoreibacter ponti]|uniref:Type IV pilus biogenesis protein PilP n=2 Tax=Litoreibacter ponti TaxID=1510457 RepID=A0A2T6BDI7_9RHOB|nr:hypothetical protein C8N43_2927 [Litoreibacter ponti]